jgi:hypothetical protein
MIPVFADKPDDLRQPHCWIDPDRVVRLTPIYGVKDRKEDFYWIASPGNPKAVVFRYEIFVFRWHKILFWQGSDREGISVEAFRKDRVCDA